MRQVLVPVTAGVWCGLRSTRCSVGLRFEPEVPNSLTVMVQCPDTGEAPWKPTLFEAPRPHVLLQDDTFCCPQCASVCIQIPKSHLFSEKFTSL